PWNTSRTPIDMRASVSAITLLALIGACHSGRSSTEERKAAHDDRAASEPATPLEPSATKPAPTDGSLPLLGGPTNGDAIYFPIHPTSIVRLDDGGWTTIWRSGFVSTVLGADGEYYVRREEG